MASDYLLVTGMRGAGKIFWWSTLQDGDMWRLIGLAEECLPPNEYTEVRTGFDVKPASDEYPGKDTRAGAEACAVSVAGIHQLC